MLIVSTRIPLVEYTSLFIPTKLRFICRAPQLSTVYNIYTLPFENKVWLTVFILVAISTVLLHFTVKVDKTENNGNERITDSILSTIAAICQMGPQLTTDTTSSRIILVT